jgi:hypothetical protein
VGIGNRLRRLEQRLGTGPRIAAAVVEEATGRVVQILQGPAGFEPAPAGMKAADLPPGCEMYEWQPETTYLGGIRKGGRPYVQVVRGIEMDVVLGRKPGLPPGCHLPPGVGGAEALELMRRWQAEEGATDEQGCR